MANPGNIGFTVINGVGVHYEQFPLITGLYGIQIATASAPTPPAGQMLLYANVDGTWHQKTSAGVDTPV